MTLETAGRNAPDRGAPLDEETIASDPVAQLTAWLDDARAAGVAQFNAMVVGTVDPDGRPSARTVLLRGLGADGLRFFTDRESRKGRALAAHPDVSALFPWYPLYRQVIVHGRVEPLDAEADDGYWAGRPWGSNVAAVASRQSEPIASRQALEAAFAAEAERYPDGSAVPRPARWGGYRIEPREVEFWQGRRERLHDRIVYLRRQDGGWRVERRQP